jgi:secreted PhoX family phosphatase
MMRRRALLAAPALLPGIAAAQTAPAVAQDDTVAPGWRRGVLIRWGDRVTFDAPPFDPRSVDAEGAGAQFGWDARIVALVTPPRAADNVARAVLAVAHTTVDAAMAFPAGADRPAVAAMMQGASILNLELQGGRWITVDGGFQKRRLTAATLCRANGPGAEALGGAIRGVLAPAGGCATPWGTLLLAEGDPQPWSGRLAEFGQGTGFGWVVEFDALDPQSIPVKQTALGRFPKADAAAAQSRDGRAVVFVAEQGAGGFLFRFVSSGPASAEALAAGALFAARREGGRVTWLALPDGAAGDPLSAARAAGATPFDAPSGLFWDARANRLLACGGFGVLALGAEGGDAGAERMNVSGLGSPALGRPVTVSADARGRVLVGTGLTGQVGDRAQALWQIEGGATTALYGAPRAADVAGAAVSPDGSAIFAAVRHPGAEPGASFARPGTRWPEFTPGQPPRSAIVSLARG